MSPQEQPLVVVDGNGGLLAANGLVLVLNL